MTEPVEQAVEPLAVAEPVELAETEEEPTGEPVEHDEPAGGEAAADDTEDGA